jgi:acyl-[acyl-carrier-protein]-phospholipid O-acyltransferase/long-chain-fatty-acid--[acyl-carrier-protein] ligase
VADWPAAPFGAALVSWADLWPWDGFPPALGLVPAVVALALLLWLSPRLLLRTAMVVVSCSLLWLRVRGRHHLPATGAVLLVANPVSYLGWLLLLAASRRRLRFVILAGWTADPWLARLLRWSGAVTLTGPGDSADAERALQRAGQALDQGEAVCIFAEGCRTRDGALLHYPRVYEILTAGRAVPVVPVCLQQPFGSLLGMWNGKFVRKYPPEWLAPVDVAFGAPLPPGTPAGEARQALQLLSAQIAVDRAPRRRPVHRQFVRMAARHPFRPCWIDSSAPGQEMNYAKAYVGSVCLTSLLRPILGDEPMVAVWLPPGRGAALANIALALLGKTSVNLNYTSSAESIQSALSQCGCKHVITARRFTARLSLDPGPGVELIHLEDLLPRVSGWQKLRALLAVVLLPGWFLERVVLRLGRHNSADLATIIFSSGSTGEPKGVMLTHGNVSANVESMIQATCLGPRDRILGVLPFFHSFGYTVTLWAPLQSGASAVYHADPRQAREIGALCREHRCTIYVSTATFLRFCLKKCDVDDFRSVRILICGAEKLPPALAEEFRARFGLLPLEGYGCTELSPACAANLPDQEFGGVAQVHNRIGTVGPPLPGCAARVVHAETGEPLPLGQEGLLLFTGANVMKGYLGKPELTAQVVRDGWYVTGDMGRIDPDGHVTLTGRLSRFAKVGGEMVPLEKVEEELHEILSTSERVCAVTCVPCASRGERLVVLYVAAQLSVFGLEVRPWCQQLSDRGLPNLWMPSERDFIAVAELPVLGSGKLNLKGVKDLALELAGRKERSSHS